MDYTKINDEIAKMEVDERTKKALIKLIDLKTTYTMDTINTSMNTILEKMDSKFEKMDSRITNFKWTIGIVGIALSIVGIILKYG